MRESEIGTGPLSQFLFNHAWETTFNSPEEEVIGLSDAGVNARQIAKRMECAPSTVSRILVMVREKGLEDGNDKQEH